MPLEQSPASAFVRPRQDYQQARKAEKVQTEQFYGSKRVARTASGGNETREKRKEELNNNNESSAISCSSRNGDIVNSSGIPRRNVVKTPDAEIQAKQRDVLRKETVDTRSPKPRRKLPLAPTNSSNKTRVPSNEVVSRRSTPDNSRRSTPEKLVEKNRGTPDRVGQYEKSPPTADNTNRPPEATRRTLDGSRKTPEISRKGGDTLRRTPEHVIKSHEAVARKNSDSNEKNSRIKKPADGGLMPSKNHDGVNDSSRSKGPLSGIKYNSLPRSHPSKNHSKFYLDIEGEEYMPKKSDGKFLGIDQNDKSPIEYGLEKLSLQPKSIKGFVNGFKSNNHEPPSFEMGNEELKQTHVALFKFLPRHKDEVLLEEGDPLSVSKISEDLWCEGTNLASGKSGVFPSRYAADILAGSSACKLNCIALSVFVKLYMEGISSTLWEISCSNALCFTFLLSVDLLSSLKRLYHI